MATVDLVAIDLYSGDRVSDWAAVKAAGVDLVIHKATEGSTYRDPTYHSRRAATRSAGLLWAGYHFATGAPVVSQIENFLGAVYPDNDPTLRLILDWESGALGVAAAKAFLAAVDARTGKRTIVYSYLAFLNNKLGAGPDRDFGSHPLWLAAYRNATTPPVPQASWPSVLLWQYSDGKSGAYPRRVAGIPGNALGEVDCNTAPGMTREQFRAAWLGDFTAPEHPRDWAWVQARLNALGASPQLVVDNQPGNNTAAAVAAFIEEHST